MSNNSCAVNAERPYDPSTTPAQTKSQKLKRDASPRAFSGETPMHSTSSSRDRGTYFDPDYSNGLVASSSLTAGQHELSQPRSAAQIHGDATELSSVEPKHVAEADQKSRVFYCTICRSNLYAKKALNRHNKDVHSPWNDCPYPHCSFTWSSGRRYTFINHLRRQHSGSVTSDSKECLGKCKDD
jgi:hypothetical protein